MSENQEQTLLSPSLTAEQRKLYDTNAAQSPLLRLPPEVRNRIWRYVLTGRCIEVFNSFNCSGQFTLSTGVFEHKTTRHGYVCAVKKERLASQNIKNKPFFQAALFGEAEKRWTRGCTGWNSAYTTGWHSACACLARRYSCAALHVCRQLYLEAALLPFAENEFVFGNERCLQAFLGRLVVQQVRAIKRIALVVVPEKAERVLWSLLTGLEQLTCLVEIPDCGDVGKEEQDRVVESLPALRHSSLQDVKVLLSAVDRYERGYRQVLQPLVTAAKAKVWETEVERRIMRLAWWRT